MRGMEICDETMGKMCVLVGTYRPENTNWIRRKKLYNLPLPSAADPAIYRKFTVVVLYAADAAPLAYAATFREVVDRAWLKANGYSLAKVPHGERYALFALGARTSAAKALSDPQAEVCVCSSRWTGIIDADFYSRPLPPCGGKSIPNVFEKIRPYFTKWKAACAFNPVQMDFFGVIDKDAKAEMFPFPPPKHPHFTFIDLFAGVGGFRLAMQGIGGKCVFTSEWDKNAQATYLSNYGEQPYGDIRPQATKDKIPENFDVLCAGFPCQPFSLAGVSARNAMHRAHGFADETQGTLFFDVLQIIRQRHPKVVFLENVRNLVNHDKGRTFDVIRRSIEAEGYSFSYKLIDASPVVPQRRVRCYMVCLRNGKKFEFPEISGNPLPLRGILEKDVSSAYTISDNLWAGHQRRTRNNLARGAGFTAFTANLDEPSHTLVARYYKDGKECLIPQEGKNPRLLTPRECARLQGFPENFILPRSRSVAYKQMGNSVAVPVLKRIAASIEQQALKVV